MPAAIPQNTLVFLYPGSIAFEVLLAAQFLHRRHPVVVATPDGEPHVDESGLVVAATAGALTSVDPATCAALLIPGGDFESIFERDEIFEHIATIHTTPAEADAAPRWTAAICAGPYLLARAGLLRGRTCSHGFEQEQLDFLAPAFDDVQHSTAAVSVDVDARIITAEPRAYVELATELAARLGVFPSNAERDAAAGWYRRAD